MSIQHSPMSAGSSVVEQLAFNQLVEGSTPSPRTIFVPATKQDGEIK